MLLPLSDNKQISSELGTRHRAALGISEISDSIVLIVSGGNKVISKAHEGTITRYIDPQGPSGDSDGYSSWGARRSPCPSGRASRGR